MPGDPSCLAGAHPWCHSPRETGPVMASGGLGPLSLAPALSMAQTLLLPAESEQNQGAPIIIIAP